MMLHEKMLPLKKWDLGWQGTPKANTTMPSHSEGQLYNIKTME